MSTQPIDYDALAQQHGGTAAVDYDALAAQYGAIQPESKPRTWLDSVKDFTSEAWKQVNPVSAVQGLNQAASHPLDTLKAMGQAQGEVEQKAETAFKKGDYAEGVRHVINYLIPMLGPQIDQAGDLVQSGQYAKGAGQTVGIAANIVGPEVIKNANLHLPIGQLPERMYQSALKPPPGSYSTAEVGKMVNTGLENKIPVSAGGIEKLNDLVSELGDKVKAQIDAGSGNGATVNKFAVSSRLKPAAKAFETQVNPEADLEAISKSGNEFLRNQPGNISASDAQALKQGTYKQLTGKAYGEMSTATKEAQKALARGIKEELEVQFPEIRGLNAQEGKLISLNDALQRAVRRIDNRDIFSLGGKIAAGAGAALGEAGGHGLAGLAGGFVLHKVLTDPYVQSRLAFAMKDASRGVTFTAARARIAAYANQLGNAVSANASNTSDQTNQ